MSACGIKNLKSMQVLGEVLRLSKIITKSLQSGDYFRKYSSFLHIFPKTSKSCKLFSDSQNAANITNESFMKHNIKSLLNFVANEIVEY
jgi:hypothetical protein